MISVFCLAPTRQHANDIVSQLAASGFAYNDISVLFPDRSNTRDFAHENSTKAPEGAAAGAGAGGVLGGALGLLAGVGLLAIPGVGPFVAAGPIMAALSGAALGGAVGGVSGALVGLGIPEFEAKRFDGKLKDGNILISVHAETTEQVAKAKHCFEVNMGTDISSGSVSPVPEPKIATTGKHKPVTANS